MRLMLICLVILVASAGHARSAWTTWSNAVIFGSDATQLATMPGRLELGGGDASRSVDLNGGFVVVGLVDAHGHLASLGKALETVDLRGALSPAELVTRVRDAKPAALWIEGRGWDQSLWAGAAFPTHHALSKAFPKRPVVLRRVDGHALLANAAAMERAGISAATTAPEGGRILRSDKGEPTGVFIDAAMALIAGHIPPATVADQSRRLKLAVAAAHRGGLTGVHDMGVGPTELAAMKDLDTRGELNFRVHAYLDGVPAGAARYEGRLLRVVGCKLFADGALGSRGAALLDAYSDEHAHKGLLQQSADQLTALATRATEAGLQVAIHAIGDAGVRAALDAHERAKTTLGRIEHAQVVHPDDFARFVRAGVVASMQPTHATSDMRWAKKRVGAERLKGAYAWRTMLNRKIPLVFGSDFPVESHDVRRGIYAAVTRQDESGVPRGGWTPEQRVTTDEAIHAFSDHARAAVPGGATTADFTVFEHDLRSLSPAKILTTRVRMVVVAGQIVYRAKSD